MAIFYTNKSAKEAIAERDQRIELLESESTDLQAELATLKDDNANLAEQVANLTSERDQASADLAELTTEHDTATEQLTAATEKLSTFDEQVEAAAIAKFQSLGGTPAPASSADPQGGHSDLYAEYRKLQSSNPVAASKFWEDNRSKILG